MIRLEPITIINIEEITMIISIKTIAEEITIPINTVTIRALTKMMKLTLTIIIQTPDTLESLNIIVNTVIPQVITSLKRGTTIK